MRYLAEGAAAAEAAGAVVVRLYDAVEELPGVGADFNRKEIPWTKRREILSL